MTTADRDRLREAVAAYAEALRANFTLPVDAQPEDQLKAPTGSLLKAVGDAFGLAVDSRTEARVGDVAGRPDLGVTVGGLLTGHVELKAPGRGARPERFTGADGQQWQRFQALPNIIYTDGSEWSLYRTGELVARVRIAEDLTVTGARDLEDGTVDKLGVLLRDFLMWRPVVPRTPQHLAKLLAPLTSILRDEVAQAAAREGSALHSLAGEWRGLLFPEADDQQFADAYAQTVTYALLLAQLEGAERLEVDTAFKTLRARHGLLAQALRILADPQVDDEIGMPLELLRRVIAAVEPARLAKRGDPWLYFYEDFLGAYDPELRKGRGVYYTPVEVVRAQVRLVEWLLTQRFGLAEKFAAEDVVVLDPAVGTGTYLLAVLDRAAHAAETRLGPGAVPGKLSRLAQRLYGFELLVGPYAVAHLRLAQRLRDVGAELPADGPQVYLTDTLETPDREPEFRASLFQKRLSEEHARAREVKQRVPILVCLGNPPYDREHHDPSAGPVTGLRRKGGWVRHGDGSGPGIFADFVEPARAAGAGVHLKNLYNDYVYFWRWALWKVFEAHPEAPGGIVTFITASSYLRGPAFVGMRRRLRETFDELWIIDLEGDSLGARKTENVFDIRTPVAIAIGVRQGAPKPQTPAKVWKTKLTGTREEKLAKLAEVTSFNSLSWHECASDWDAPFYATGTAPFFTWPLLTDLFPWQHAGVQMKRTWPIGETRSILERRWRHLVSAPSSQRARLFREADRKVTGTYASLHDPSRRDPAIAKLSNSAPPPPIHPYAFRAFDVQWILADARLGDRMRPALWRAHSDRQVYLTSLLTKVLGEGPALVATGHVPDLDHFSGRGAKDVIPLWRDAAATEPNVTQGLLDQLQTTYGAEVTAEHLFSYCYGLLVQRGYVERFWEELELPGPRIPLTKDRDLFFRVAEVGRRLLWLHTYGERFRPTGAGLGIPPGSARCTKAVTSTGLPDGYTYDRATGTLRVGDGEFAPVAPEVWDFSVSGLQVVKSWLDYRKRDRAGRSSSPLDEIRPDRWDFTDELLELLWVLEHTIALEPEARSLFEAVLSSDVFAARELPQPSDAERIPPDSGSTGTSAQGRLDID